MYRRTLDTIQTGGTNHPLTPFQLTINKGSMKRELQGIAISILCTCLNNNISIDVE
jgi:hypothetical protein